MIAVLERETLAVVDPEFSALIPPLTAGEYAQLEANLIAEGCRDALVVWDGILLDGHNRLRICHELGLPFETHEVDLPDRQAARDWILANQLGRRNLTRDQFAVLLGQRYLAQKKREGRPEKLGHFDPVSDRTSAILAARHGVSEKTVRRAADVVAALPEPVVRAGVRGETTLFQAKKDLAQEARRQRRQHNEQLVAAAPQPITLRAVFATIVIDPPWDYADEGPDDLFGRSKPSYATMPIAEIAALPVGELADVDCHLYLWITNRLLHKGFALLERWGFRYVTCLTWCKPHFGIGQYFRGQTEQVLFGVRGSQPLKRRDVGTWFAAPRGPRGHSSKPPEFFDLVESCSPGPYLEMFARGGREGWTSWGAEA